MRKLTVLPWVARSALPQEGGVYLVYDHTGLVYIGVTNDLRYRLSTHHHRDTFEELTGVCLGYVLISDATERATLERELISEHRPRLNRIGNPGHPSRLTEPVTLTLVLDRATVDRVDDYFFEHRCDSRAAALRTLLTWALDNNPP